MRHKSNINLEEKLAKIESMRREDQERIKKLREKIAVLEEIIKKKDGLYYVVL